AAVGTDGNPADLHRGVDTVALVRIAGDVPHVHADLRDRVMPIGGTRAGAQVAQLAPLLVVLPLEHTDRIRPGLAAGQEAVVRDAQRPHLLQRAGRLNRLPAAQLTVTVQDAIAPRADVHGPVRSDLHVAAVEGGNGNLRLFPGAAVVLAAHNEEPQLRPHDQCLLAHN